MKRGFVIGLSAAAVVLMMPFASKVPVLANLWDAGVAMADSMHPSHVQLKLVGEKQVVTQDAQGNAQISWQASDRLTVRPGDVIRYRLSGQNDGERAVKNLALVQPIPQGTVYVLNSATVADMPEIEVTYSIDGGHQFVKNPTIQVTLPNGKVETRPAPAEAYTHVRWSAGKTLVPNAVMAVAYQVKVRQ